LQLVKTVAHPKIVEERLGHSTVVIAMDLYSPLMDGMETSAAERIDEAFMIAKSSGSYCSISVASGCAKRLGEKSKRSQRLGRVPSGLRQRS
jgi:hypothetical protein